MARSAAMLALAGAASACTEIQLRSPEGDLVVANSVEAADLAHAMSVTTSRRGEHHGGHATGCERRISPRAPLRSTQLRLTTRRCSQAWASTSSTASSRA